MITTFFVFMKASKFADKIHQIVGLGLIGFTVIGGAGFIYQTAFITSKPKNPDYQLKRQNN